MSFMRNRSRGRPPHPDVLTPAEWRVLDALRAGGTNEEIAARLELSPDTIKTHISSMLAKLELRHRHELAAWRGEPDAASRTALGRFSLAAPFAWLRDTVTSSAAGKAAIVVGVAAFSIAVIVGMQAVAGGGAAGDEVTLERGDPTPLEAAAYGQEHEGEGVARTPWTSRAVADLDERDLDDLVALVYSPPAPGIMPWIVHLVERASGTIVGEIEGQGAFPLVAFDRELGRLVISDMRSDVAPGQEQDEGGFSPWFWVVAFDVRGGLTLHTEVPLSPHRTQGTSGPSRIVERGDLTLSADGRYAYVNWGGEEGEDPGIAVIDLDGPPEVIDTAPFPGGDGARSCGRIDPALYPYEASAVLVTCPEGGLVQVINPDGSVREVVDIEGMGPIAGQPDWGDRIVAPATAVETPGGLGLIDAEGGYSTVDGSGATLAARALPERTTLLPDWASDVYRLDGERLVLPYRTREQAAIPIEPLSPGPASGFVVFNTASTEIEQRFTIEHRGSYAIDPQTVAVVEDGRVDLVDLVSGTIAQSFETLTLLDVIDDPMDGRPFIPRVR